MLLRRTRGTIGTRIRVPPVNFPYEPLDAGDALIAGAETGRCEGEDPRDLVRNMSVDHSAPLGCVAVSRGMSGCIVEIGLPDEHAERFLVTHVH